MKKILLILLMPLLALPATAGEIDTVWSKPWKNAAPATKYSGFKLSEDGTRAAAGYGDKIYFFDATTGSQENFIDGNISETNYGEFKYFDIDPGFNYATMSNQRGGGLWNVKTGELIDEIEGIAISNDGKFVIARDYTDAKFDRLIKYDIEQRKGVDTISRESDKNGIYWPIAWTISYDDKYFVFSEARKDANGTMKVFITILDFITFDIYDEISFSESCASFLPFSQSNKLFIPVSKVLLNIETGDLKTLFKTKDYSSVAISRNERYLYASGLTFRVYDIETEKEIFKSDKKFYALGMQTYPDNKFILTFRKELTKIKAPWTYTGVEDNPIKSEANASYSNDMLEFSYFLEKSGDVRISVFDINGNIVKELFSGFQEVGEHTVNKNIHLVSGSYFVVLEQNGSVVTKKLLVVR